MAISVRLKDVLPLLAALLLVFFAFSLPPFYEEAEPASAQAESGRVLIIDAGHGGRTAARLRLRACRKAA